MRWLMFAEEHTYIISSNSNVFHLVKCNTSMLLLCHFVIIIIIIIVMCSLKYGHY